MTILKQLRATPAPLLPPSLQHVLDTCPVLEELHMDGCAQLNALSLNWMPALRLLSVRACRSLSTLDLKCRWAKLGLGGGGAGVRAEGLGPALARLWVTLLSVRACRSLSTLDLKCRYARG